MSRIGQVLAATAACLCSLAVVVGTPAVLGQIKPPLDARIPAYHPLIPLKGQLTISGSESMKPLIQAWTDDLKRRHPAMKVTVGADGSQTGLTALLEHQTEVAAMSRRMASSEIAEFLKEYGYEPVEVPVALDALAIFVHQDNPLAGLSLAELDSMFCRERRRGLDYPVRSWGLVGLVDDWFEAPIRIYGRDGNSGTSYFFLEEVCKGGTFFPHMVKAHGPASVVMDLMKDPQGIGFSGIGYRTSTIRPIPLASVKGGRYVEPSFETVLDGSYPLKRTLYLYVARPPQKDPNPIVRELVRFALSQQGQQLALDHGFFPLPLAEITRVSAKWSAPAPSETQDGRSAAKAK
jgi:phosphate transport system substrate-binding protein